MQKLVDHANTNANANTNWTKRIFTVDELVCDAEEQLGDEDFQLEVSKLSFRGAKQSTTSFKEEVDRYETALKEYLKS